MKKSIFIAILTLCSTLAFGYNISKSGRDAIKEYEKCSLVAYWDNGAYSIGYGHRSPNIKKGMRISKKKAEQYFNEDIKEAERYANLLLKRLPYKYKFSQGFFDGFTSWIYNVGYGNAKNSDFYHKLQRCRVKNGKMNKSDFDFTLAKFKKSFTYCKGNVSRRKSEHKMMYKI